MFVTVRNPTGFISTVSLRALNITLYRQMDVFSMLSCRRMFSKCCTSVVKLVIKIFLCCVYLLRAIQKQRL